VNRNDDKNTGINGNAANRELKHLVKC